MAIVYRCHDERLGRPVAVKVLADNLAADESFRRRFVREAQLAARLQHPNVVSIYDTGEAEGRPFIVMEYVEGETLADVVRREGRLEPDRAVELAIQACAGLDHAHRAGLVHRDVKPQNLLLRDDGVLKVADFGIARSRHATRLTDVGGVLGTAAYLAPEQAAGEDVTAAADVYALGVVLYQMLAGEVPHDATSLAELLVRQRDRAVAPLRPRAAGVTQELEETVMRCLARLPEYRPPSAAALAEELASAALELPTRPLPRPDGGSASAPTATYPSSEPRTTPYRTGLLRSDGGRLLLATVVAAAVVAVALVLSAGGDEPAADPPADAPALEQAEELSRWLRAGAP